MKKFLTFILIFFCFSSFNGSTVFAKVYTAEYLRIITEDTAFYKDENGKQFLFYLPYTYYVKVLGSKGDYLHVEIGGEDNLPALDGYVLSSLLYDDDLTVLSPYPVITITTATDTPFYLDKECTEVNQYLFPNRNLTYYGEINDGTMRIFYTAYNGKLGYVKEENLFPFSIPNHPNEQTFITNSFAPENEVISTNNGTEVSDILKIVIISCLALAGVTALFIAFKKKEKPIAISYYDDNDYE